MDLFTIKDLEKISGIKAHTIRIWEQRYQFLKPKRTETNIRFYSNDELKKLLRISLLNKHGFKISLLDKMNEEELENKIQSLTQLEAQHERIVNELVECMIEVDLERLESILERYIQSKGIERMIIQIIFPFMEKIGILWITNHINPAQEHLVSNIIRQKLIVGIDSVVKEVKINKTVLLFLPEGEFHELGVLFVSYLLKCKGVSTIYLGANVPLKDVEYLVKLKKPSYIYSHLTSVGHSFNFDKFILAITKKFEGTPILLSGLLTNTYEKKIPSQITFKKTLKEVMEFVATL
jgi:DNA-binding transcriptional MerR regulator